MSHISIPELAKRTGYSRRHLQRMAADGLIPTARRTPGGHWRIGEGQMLDTWLNQMGMKLIARQALGRSRSDPLRVAAYNYRNRLVTYIMAAMRGEITVTEEMKVLIKEIARVSCAAQSKIDPSWDGDLSGQPKELSPQETPPSA